MGDTTTIPISKKFHEWLKGKGKKGESYEDIIKRLLMPKLAEELGELGSEDKSTSSIADSDTSDLLDN